MNLDNLAVRIQKEARMRTLVWIAGAFAAGSIFVVGGIYVATVFPSFLSQPESSSDQALAQATEPTHVATTTSGPNAYGHISLIGKAAIVYDLTNGQTLYAQNADAQLPLASVTKLLTLYAASHVLSPTTPITMSSTSLAQSNDAADVGFKVGETFAFEDIARLTLAASSNIGAEAIAEAADSVHHENTSSLLAGAAASMGLLQTHAENGTGLDVTKEISGGYGSVHDIAVLAGSLVTQSPQVAVATTLSRVSITSKQGIQHSFANTNIDVTHVPHLLLSKTGYTDLAGGNLVIVYDAGLNHPIAIVVLGSTEKGRFVDVRQLLAATFAHFAGTMPPL